MIEEHGRVVDIDAEGVWVQVEKQSACASCSARAGCGQRLLAEHGTSNKQVVICIAPSDALTVRVDDRVVIGIEEGAFIKASLALYLLPLLLLIVGAASAEALSLSEGWVVLSGGLGLVVGLGLVRFIARHWQRGREYHPVLMRLV